MSGDHNMYASGSGDGQRSGWRKRTIMEMAREAGAIHIHERPKEFAVVGNEAIEAFAKLVREDEAQKYKWDVHSCGPTCERYACVATREAVLAERERVLKILDDQGTWAHTGDLVELVKENT